MIKKFYNNMNIKLFIVVFAIAIGISHQQCAAGCLKCNSQNQCLICDVSNNYSLNSTQCVLSTQTNCQILSLDGGCVYCTGNYYINSNTKACVQVATTSVIANCIYYDSATSCSKCKTGYVVVNQLCAVVNTTIANCQYYKADGVCAICNSGYIFAYNGTSCIQSPATANCLMYTYYKCSACQSGYTLDQNTYITYSYSSTDLAISSVYLSLVSFMPSTGYPVCRGGGIVPNCLTSTISGGCSQCMAGYFVQNGTCVENPSSTIPNCAIYSSVNACTSCNQGYYLASSTLCTAVTAITLCSTYSTTASSSVCTACNTGNYLAGTTCTARTKTSITGCGTYTVTADNCAVCNTGLRLTDDSLACLAVIANCQTYATSTSTTTALVCSLCNNGYYLGANGASCTAGTVANCMTYAASANTCTVCNNTYYLTGTTCTAHVSIPSCLTYSATTANTCTACVTGFYSFALSNTCTTNTLIANCLTYSSATVCTSCAAGYYVSGGTCVAPATGYANCLLFSSPACTLCAPNFMLSGLTNNNCTTPLDYVTATCGTLSTPTNTAASPATFGSSRENANTCYSCGDYMSQLRVWGQIGICVNVNQLYLYKGFATVGNCKRYGFNWNTIGVLLSGNNPSNIVCMECNSGYYLTGYEAYAYLSTNTQLTCSQTCDTTSPALNAIIPDNNLGYVNLCVKPASTLTGTIGFSSSGLCQRYIRYTITTMVQATTGFTSTYKDSNDYVCLVSAPNAFPTTPSYVLAIDTAANKVQSGDGTGQPGYLYGFYTPYLIKNTGSLNDDTQVDFGGAYSNTLDGSSIFPTVFNYNGILPYVKEINTKTQFDNAQISLSTSTLANCDIFYIYNTNQKRLGWAFSSTVGGSTYITVATNTNNVLTCLRCKFGYMLSYTPGGQQSSNMPMPSCTSMTNCAATYVFGGLPTHLNTFFSCHSCTSSGGSTTYPTIYIEVDAAAVTGDHKGVKNGAFVGWSIYGVYSSLSVADQASGFKCATAPTTLKTGDTSTGASISGCAAFGYLTPLTTLTASDGTGTAPTTPLVTAVCLACGPGTFPTYGFGATVPTAVANDFSSSVPKYYVTQCNPSPNCASAGTVMFNGCQVCSPDVLTTTPPTYYAFTDQSMAGCSTFASGKQATPNCFMLNKDGECAICKASYYLNSDSICESLSIPNTASGASFSIAYSVAIQNLAQSQTEKMGKLYIKRSSLVYLSGSNPYGVSSCSAGYIQFPVHPYETYVCGYSAMLNYTQITISTKNMWINKCLAYVVAVTKAECVKCASGYIPTSDRLSCVSVTATGATLTSCTFALIDTPLKCSICVTGMVSINGACITPNIANCTTYEQKTGSATIAAPTCSVCANGSVRSVDKTTCSLGKIANCYQYQDGQNAVCTQCAPNYVLLTSTTNVYYCYPVSSNYNCASFSNSGTNGMMSGSLKCSTCNANATANYWPTTFTASASLASTVCLPFTSIPNCVQYSQSASTVPGNTFGCTQCATGYYVSQLACVQRTKQISQCANLDPASDSCLSCSAGYYLNQDGSKCTAFPTGIPYCIQYSSATACTQCASGYYLSSNACTASTVIAGCDTYSANNVCATCGATYYKASSTSCVSATATNCLTYASATACATCSANFVIQSGNCVSALTSLPNCAAANTAVSPATCTTCNTGYYLSSGTCTAVTTTVTDCLVYDSATTCTMCSASKVLSVDRKSCFSPTSAFSDPDERCTNQALLATATCSQCANGYYFSNGNCVACSNSYSSGCFMCDPSNPSNCLMCRPTFYMNSTGLCTSTVATIPTTNTTGKGASIISLTQAFAAVLILFFVRMN